MKNVISLLMPLCWILNAASLTAAGVVLTKQTPSESEAYWKPIEFGSIENYPTSVVITPKGTKQTSTITRYQIGVVIEFVDLNATSIVSEDQFNKFKAARDSLAGYASQCKQASGILSAVVQNYDQVLRYYADGNVLIAGKWISKHDYEAKMKAESLAATAGSIPEMVVGGKTFKNVRVTKVVGERISIMHEGGIASMLVADLTESQLAMLKVAFSDAFAAHIKKVEEEAALKKEESKQAETDMQRKVATQPAMAVTERPKESAVKPMQTAIPTAAVNQKEENTAKSDVIVKSDGPASAKNEVSTGAHGKTMQKVDADESPSERRSIGKQEVESLSVPEIVFSYPAFSETGASRLLNTIRINTIQMIPWLTCLALIGFASSWATGKTLGLPQRLRFTVVVVCATVTLFGAWAFGALLADHIAFDDQLNLEETDYGRTAKIVKTIFGLLALGGPPVFLIWATIYSRKNIKASVVGNAEIHVHHKEEERLLTVDQIQHLWKNGALDGTALYWDEANGEWQAIRLLIASLVEQSEHFTEISRPNRLLEILILPYAILGKVIKLIPRVPAKLIGVKDFCLRGGVHSLVPKLAVSLVFFEFAAITVFYIALTPSMNSRRAEVSAKKKERDDADRNSLASQYRRSELAVRQSSLGIDIRFHAKAQAQLAVKKALLTRSGIPSTAGLATIAEREWNSIQPSLSKDSKVSLRSGLFNIEGAAFKFWKDEYTEAYKEALGKAIEQNAPVIR